MRMTKRMKRLRAEAQRWLDEQPYEIEPWQFDALVAFAARIEIVTQRQMRAEHHDWEAGLNLVNLARGK